MKQWKPIEKKGNKPNLLEIIQEFQQKLYEAFYVHPNIMKGKDNGSRNHPFLSSHRQIFTTKD